MEIESKFSIKDYVWYMCDNKPLGRDVTGVGILLEKGKEPSIDYILHFDDDIDESKVYATKEELLKSL